MPFDHGPGLQSKPQFVERIGRKLANVPDDLGECDASVAFIRIPVHDPTIGAAPLFVDAFAA